MDDKIAEGDFVGENKATARVTICPLPAPGVYKVGDQTYFSHVFRADPSFFKELPNVKSVQWERSIDSEVATCTIELFNTRPLPPGTGPDTGNTFDLLGYYTYNRGDTPYSSTAWGHAKNEWRAHLIPDRIIRTYQGYGANYDVLPENDTNLVLTGVWWVDDVTYTADGLITLTCRDAARLLMDQIAFPPVVPLAHYPLNFDPYHQVDNPDIVTTTGSWIRPRFKYSSVVPYYYHYAGGSVYGHHAVDAFDGDPNTFWLSVGNAQPSAPYSTEYIEAHGDGQTLSAARVHVAGGPYKVYLSLQVNGTWLGAARISYTPPNNTGIDNGAGIPWLQQGTVAKDGSITFNFGAHANVTAVRFSFTDLYDFGLGHPYRYRAAVRTFEVSTQVTVTTDGGTHTEGNFGDYSEIVKRLLAYGGFYWPQAGTMRLTKNNAKTYNFAAHDPYLVKGRVWGDVKMAGVASKTELGVAIWDKKPLMDGITYVKDILGFVFFVDEQGAAIFRSPNLYKLGNWKTDVDGLNATRTTQYITIRDDETILGLRAKLSSRNIRETVFVANTSGKIGACSSSRVPNKPRLRRVGGWTDQNFATSAEVQIMADLITLRQLFTYRQTSLRIPANPAIQIDDQVQIIERTTGEAYFHYVRGISSNWDLESGKWTYDITTSWLGSDPQAEWVFRTTDLATVTKNYLAALWQV